VKGSLPDIDVYRRARIRDEDDYEYTIDPLSPQAIQLDRNLPV
jgi:hypothetical protein